jgi:BirA family transcriptional regulator, biotin operon repressor / biotin---[acetyl-CoA-carboxylase] ligase
MSLAPLAAWRGDRLGPVELLAETDSTNAEALRRVEQGRAADGLVLVAERQSAGRGSRGRSLSHLPGRSLALTALVRWRDAASLHLATWAAVLSATDLAREHGLRPTVKWPNDALLDGGKFCGVLVETRLFGALPWAAIGVGLNVGHEPSDFAGEFRRPPTSLKIAGAELDLEEAHRELLAALDRRLASAGRDAGAALARDLALRLELAGREVVATLADREERGTFAELRPDGWLRLVVPGGERRLHGAHVVALAPTDDR